MRTQLSLILFFPWICRRPLAYRDTCDSIALAHSLASAALLTTNNMVFANRSSILAGETLCLLLGCNTYTLQANDTCAGIERAHIAEGVRLGDVRRYNAWVNYDCSNLVEASERAYGRVICLSPQNGASNDDDVDNGSAIPHPNFGWGMNYNPPPENSTLAPGTAELCEAWYTAAPGDLCATITAAGKTYLDLLLTVNPSLVTDAGACDAAVVAGLTYCTRPLVHWDEPWTMDPEPTTTLQIPTDSEAAATSTTSTSSSAEASLALP